MVWACGEKFKIVEELYKMKGGSVKPMGRSGRRGNDRANGVAI